MLRKCLVLLQFRDGTSKMQLEETMLPWTVALFALWLMISQVAQAGCETPTQVAQLGVAGRVGEEAFAAMDAEALLTQASLARTQILPCVEEPLTKQDAAAFHRLMALEAFISHDNRRVLQELHASLLLQPSYSFPIQVAAPGHPLLALYEAAGLVSDGDGEKIYPPPNGYVLLGGVRNAARYSQTPVIIQVFTYTDETQTLRETRYVQPGEATPNWSGNAFGLTAADLGIDLEDLQRRSVLADPRPWYIAAGVALAASGALYGFAMDEKARFVDPFTPDGDLAGHASRANSLGIASLTTSGAALAFAGLGIGFHVKFGANPSRSITPTSEVTTDE
jgi:hypothetical protein